MAEFINTVDVIGDDALTDSIIDRSITEFKDNIITKLGDRAFCDCAALTDVDLPAVTSIGESAFWNCTNLKSVSMAELPSIVESMFKSLKNLSSVDFPAATSIRDYAFQGCSNLTSVNFPVATSMGYASFHSCSNLTSVNFPVATSIDGAVFYGCSNLTAVILRNTAQVCTLGHTGALANTPIKSGTGYIYVPRCLLSDDDASKDYRRATNWSTFTTFRALEDYTVDGTTTGELDPTKI